jgi:hypothetical protein
MSTGAKLNEHVMLSVVIGENRAPRRFLAMEAVCERCGEPAPEVAGASHVFCEFCEGMASTGARSSNELLFSTRPPPAEKKSGDSLEQLASDLPTFDDGASLIQLPAIPASMPLLPPPRAPRRTLSLRTLLPAIAVATSAFLFAGSAALAWHSREREKRILRIAETMIVQRETPPRERWTAPIAERRVEQEVETIETPIVAHRTAPPPVESVVEEPAVDEALTPLEPSLPSRPSRTEVREAMNAMQGAVAQCSDGTHGTVRASVTFLGTTGAATHAEVLDSSFPPGVRSCIARVLRETELPRFSQDRLTVAFPYQL